ncbi:hypothetical protein LPW11_06865 [Geomonas sp. RF6]|uniref:hypothetical protein n=1 Tax=Geomonas sp. RF6 TaxID=2897342 RepID=UPI001E5FE179|nr:hypothetical protein [Geomonas sp. RF6]UFS71906.1 hypothetical protein LPW11_06865 [Geomonas sp. RF6]
MKYFTVIFLTIISSTIYTSCYAVSCNCEDWMAKGGYCVDYIKDRIPAFPIPYKDDMPSLKNTDVTNVTEGDVAIFTIKNYWHVAYVEKVHRNANGNATAIDVTEMNYGDKLSFPEFKAKWKSKSRDQWNRAACCGITDNYDRITWRKNIALGTVKQIWSPDDVAPEGTGGRVNTIAGKVKEVVNRLLQYTGEL